MFQFLARQPLAIVGAIGLIGVFKGFLTLHEDILQIVQAFQTVTFYIWDFLFGWIDIYLFAVPNWVKQYLILGVIHASATRRASRIIKHKRDLLFLEIASNYLIIMIIWPLLYILAFWKLLAAQWYKKLLNDRSFYMNEKKEFEDRFGQLSRGRFEKSVKGYADSLKVLRVALEFLCWALALILVSYGFFFFKG